MNEKNEKIYNLEPVRIQLGDGKLTLTSTWLNRRSRHDPPILRNQIPKRSPGSAVAQIKLPADETFQAVQIGEMGEVRGETVPGLKYSVREKVFERTSTASFFKAVLVTAEPFSELEVKHGVPQIRVEFTNFKGRDDVFSSHPELQR